MYGIRISHMLIALTWQTDNTHMFHVVTIKCDNGVWSIHLLLLPRRAWRSLWICMSPLEWIWLNYYHCRCVLVGTTMVAAVWWWWWYTVCCLLDFVSQEMHFVSVLSTLLLRRVVCPWQTSIDQDHSYKVARCCTPSSACLHSVFLKSTPRAAHVFII